MSWYLLPSGMPYHAVDSTSLAQRIRDEGASILEDADVAAAIVAWNNRVPGPAGTALDFVRERDLDDTLADQVSTPGSATGDAIKATTVPRIDGGRIRSKAVADGTDQSTIIQAEIATLAMFGKGSLELGAGTIYANVVLPALIELLGCGSDKTTLKAVAGSNTDTIKGVSFATLTGKSYDPGDLSRGCYKAAVRRMTVDGDKSTNTSGYACRLWGRSIEFSDVVFQNGADDNIWTEYTTHPDGSAASMIEGTFINVKSNGAIKSGWNFRGPHDSNIISYQPVNNGLWGFESSSSDGKWVGGVKGTLWNSWLNGSGSYKFGASFALTNSIASGAGGLGIDMAAGLGSCSFQGIIGGHADGIVIRGTNHEFDLTLNGISGTAVKVGSSGMGNGAGPVELHLRGDSIGTVLDTTNATGPVMAFGRFNNVTAALHVGGYGSLDWINLAENGDSSTLVQILPGSSLTAVGWNPKFPASNDTLVTRSSTDKLSNKIIGHLAAAQTLAANGAVTMDSSAGSIQRVTLNANATSSTITNAATNAQMTVEWIQDVTGGRTYVWPTSCKFAGGAGPSDTTASTRTSVTFIHDGSFWREISRAVAVPA